MKYNIEKYTFFTLQHLNDIDYKSYAWFNKEAIKHKHGYLIPNKYITTLQEDIEPDYEWINDCRIGR